MSHATFMQCVVPGDVVVDSWTQRRKGMQKSERLLSGLKKQCHWFTPPGLQALKSCSLTAAMCTQRAAVQVSVDQRWLACTQEKASIATMPSIVFIHLHFTALCPLQWMVNMVLLFLQNGAQKLLAAVISSKSDGKGTPGDGCHRRHWLSGAIVMPIKNTVFRLCNQMEVTDTIWLFFEAIHSWLVSMEEGPSCL